MSEIFELTRPAGSRPREQVALEISHGLPDDPLLHLCLEPAVALRRGALSGADYYRAEYYLSLHPAAPRTKHGAHHVECQ